MMISSIYSLRYKKTLYSGDFYFRRQAPWLLPAKRVGCYEGHSKAHEYKWMSLEVCWVYTVDESLNIMSKTGAVLDVG